MKFSKSNLYLIISFFFIADLQAFTFTDSTLTIPDFRNVKWGSSLEDVKEMETARYLQTFSGFGIEALSYEGNFAGVEVRIDYTFKNKKLTEGSYTVISENNFREDFQTLMGSLENDYGSPGYSSGRLYTSDSVWIKINEYGYFIGPSFYWVFPNGFISLISEKFKDEITLTILFIPDLSIEEYNSKNKVEMKGFEIIRLDK